jgi:hypothetical protein
VLSGLLITACGDAGGGVVPYIPGGGTSLVRYAAGYEKNTSGKEVATVWKIKGSRVTPFPLSGGTKNARAVRLAVKGTDLYAAGYEQNAGNIPIAKIWTISGDGTVTSVLSLTDGTKSAGASALVVKGDDLYVAGYEQNAGHVPIAKIWKISGDGTVTPVLSLTDGTESAGVTNLVVNGDDLYAAGYEIDALINRFVWKIRGGTVKEAAITLPTAMTSSEIALAVQGGTLYAAGNDYDLSKIWRINNSGTAIAETFSVNETPAAVTALAVKGTDLYAAGYEGGYNAETATVWRMLGTTGIPVVARLPGPEVTVALALALEGADFHLAGYERKSVMIARVWTISGDTVTTVAPAGENESVVTSLVLVRE